MGDYDTIPIWAPFSNGGVPAAGLVPKITIIRVSDKVVVINAQNMTEIGQGHYYYLFSPYNWNELYVWTIDGGASLSDGDRYKFGVGDWTEKMRRLKRVLLAP